MANSDRLYFLGLQITADDDCSHEIKRRLLLGRKAMTNLDSILKRRDITMPTKVCVVKAMVFWVVMDGCESWTIKKPECWRIDAFERWCWKRLLKVPSTARRSSQSILEEINPDYSLEALILKLKLQYFGHLMQRTFHSKGPWCWERLKVGGEGHNRGWNGWMASPTQFSSVQWLNHVWLFVTPWTAARQASLFITNSQSLLKLEFKQAPGVGDGEGSLTCCSPWDLKELDTNVRLNWADMAKKD